MTSAARGLGWHTVSTAVGMGRWVRAVPGQGLGTRVCTGRWDAEQSPVLLPATRVSSARIQACSMLMNLVLIGVPRGSRLGTQAAVTSAGAEITLRAMGRRNVSGIASGLIC